MTDQNKGIRDIITAIVAIVILFGGIFLLPHREPTQEEVEVYKLKQATRHNVGGHIVYKTKIDGHLYWYHTGTTNITHCPDCPCLTK